MNKFNPTQNTMEQTLVWRWYMYDWGNSAYGAIIITFVFSVYFTTALFDNPHEGSAVWSYIMAFAGLAVAILAQLAGVLADQGRNLRYWIRLTTFLCVLTTAGLVCISPESSSYILALGIICIVMSHIFSELGMVAYNAYLPYISSLERRGAISSIGWGLGYVGGIISLALVLILFIGLKGYDPIISLPKDNDWPIRATAIFVALWYLLFSIPLMFGLKPENQLSDTNDDKKNRHHSQICLKAIWAELQGKAKFILKHNHLLKLIVASMFYRDGLATLFAVGGTFAAAAFDLDFTALLIFAVAMNFSAGLGALIFAKLDHIWGSYIIIIVCLVGLILSGCIILFIYDQTTFIALSCVLGLFIGPLQASSRTYVSYLAQHVPENISDNGDIHPHNSQAGIFGFYAFSGKAVAFTGPLLYAMATDVFDNARAGLVCILVLWIIGLFIMLMIRNK